MVSDFYIIVKVNLPLILETRNGNKLLKQFVCLSFAAYRAQFCGTVWSFKKRFSVVSDKTIVVILNFQRFLLVTYQPARQLCPNLFRCLSEYHMNFETCSIVDELDMLIIRADNSYHEEMSVCREFKLPGVCE